jgi:single-stranded-DNA-specific exonuclease
MVQYALEKLGIPIIVTDHHHRQEEKVPKLAKAIFHIPALSGSGVAYYVGKEIMQYQISNTQFSISKNINSNSLELGIRNLEHAFGHDYVGIAAIGTIADLVPLQGPSRSIAYHGLKNLTSTQRPGLVALKKVSDHIGKTVTTYEVGFLLAPRINASGRLEDALDALRLLCTKDGMKARSLAEKLNALNIQRQNMVKDAVEEALKIVESQKDKEGNLPRILIIHQNYDSDSSQPDRLNTSMPTMWHEGIIGLIASKVCEKYHRPTNVLTSTDVTPSPRSALALERVPSHGKDEYNDPSLGRVSPLPVGEGTGGVLKASCRSIPNFHMTEYLSAHKELLIKFGGHEMAAGFSMNEDKLSEFTAQSQKYADAHITYEMLERTITVDCELPLGLASIEFAEMLERMAPFGMGNAKPVFMSSGKIMNVQTMGREQKHARFRLSQGTEGLDFVAFGKAEEILMKSQEDKNFNIVYTLDINRWNGSEKVQGKLIAVLSERPIV